MECLFEWFITKQTSSSLLGGGVMGLKGAFRENSQLKGERLINDRHRASVRFRDAGHVPTRVWGIRVISWS